MMKNTGIHHVSVLVRSAKKAYDFYTNILGLKMFLKTVNQDDPTMYHLFFGDQEAREGTEFTVFEMSHFRDNQFGTNAIERVMFFGAISGFSLLLARTFGKNGVLTLWYRDFPQSRNFTF